MNKLSQVMPTLNRLNVEWGKRDDYHFEVYTKSEAHGLTVERSLRSKGVFMVDIRFNYTLGVWVSIYNCED